MTELMNGPLWIGVDFFTVRAHFEDPLHVVAMSGDLDLASRAAALDACTSDEYLDVLVDLSDLRFMDCAGYCALVAATSILERRGGSMVLMNPVGEPRRLLMLIEELDLDPCAPLRYDTPYVSPASTAPSSAATCRFV